MGVNARDRSQGEHGARTGTVLILCAVALALSGCSGERGATDPRSGDPVDLDAVEIRQYQGQKLGSAADFRENSIKGPQSVDLEDYRLEVSGEVTSPLTLSYDEVLRRRTYRKVVTLNCVEGWSVKVLWEGIRIRDLLEQAGYDAGASTIIFHCADGYTTSLPLDVVVRRELLLAHRMNGIDLPRELGFPFMVVAEDRWGYKWARWVTRIEVSDDADYEGYWESRGYDNDATLPSNR